MRYSDDGKSKEETEKIDLPADVSNGLILTLLKNVNPQVFPKTLSFVAATPKPRLVKLAISSAGEEPFSTGGRRRTATHYVLKVDIGGLSGLLAPGEDMPDRDAAPVAARQFSRADTLLIRVPVYASGEPPNVSARLVSRFGSRTFAPREVRRLCIVWDTFSPGQKAR